MPSKSQPTIDQKLTLRDLLDGDLLRDFLENFSEFFGMRLQLLDERGSVYVSHGEYPQLCMLIKGEERVQQHCDEASMGFAMIPLEVGTPEVHTCFTGLYYAIAVVTVEFDEVGRAVFGPFRSENSTLPEKFPNTNLPRQRIEQALEKVPYFDLEKVKRIAAFFTSMMDIFMFLSAKRILTSRLHLDTIFRAREEIFREMESEMRSDEDRAELERLKAIF